MAFNAAGTLFLTTGSGGGAGNNLLYKMTFVSTRLTQVGATLPNDIGSDLTACSAPLSVLPVSSMLNFSAALHNDAVELSWSAMKDESVKDYAIEYSKDGVDWSDIGTVEKKYSDPGTTNSYSYIHTQYAPENNFYRVTQNLLTGKENISSIKLVNGGNVHIITIGPNPAKDIIYI